MNTASLRERIGDFHQFFFLFNLPIDICGDFWYNRGGDWRAADASQGPFSRSVPPYANFSRLLAAPVGSRIWPEIMRKVKPLFPSLLFHNSSGTNYTPKEREHMTTFSQKFQRGK